MRLRGGYNIGLAGRPGALVVDLPVPDRLVLPLVSRCFRFKDIRVEEGVRVPAGTVLASDPKRFSAPLIAAYGGTVRLDEIVGHIVLESLHGASPGDSPHSHMTAQAGARGGGFGGAGASLGSPADARKQLVVLGAWHFIADARTSLPVDPAGKTHDVIVSAVHLEPFVASAEALLDGRLDSFVRGLEQLHELTEGGTIHVAVADGAGFTTELAALIAHHSWCRIHTVTARYPFGHPLLILRRFGPGRDSEHPVWAIGTAGVLAIERALTSGAPSVERLIALGGPAVSEPVHLRAVIGYPVDEITSNRLCRDDVRVISGGVFTGSEISLERSGLDFECNGLTILDELRKRHMLAFARPGLWRNSYGRTFVSRLCPGCPPEHLNTTLAGELRACVSCGQCVDVCPVGILPSVIHKFLQADEIDEVERMRVDLCIECGLCSFVCPSKIELLADMRDAKRLIREDREAQKKMEAKAKREEEKRAAVREALAAEDESAEEEAGA